MNVSGEVLLGGAITLFVALIVFWLQERRARQSFEVLTQFLESLARVLTEGARRGSPSRETPGGGS
jgi:hypothetical protein